MKILEQSYNPLNHDARLRVRASPQGYATIYCGWGPPIFVSPGCPVEVVVRAVDRGPSTLTISRGPSTLTPPPEWHDFLP